jgi:hypothetical protein
LDENAAARTMLKEESIPITLAWILDSCLNGSNLKSILASPLSFPTPVMTSLFGVG